MPDTTSLEQLLHVLWRMWLFHFSTSETFAAVHGLFVKVLTIARHFVCYVIELHNGKKNKKLALGGERETRRVRGTIYGTTTFVQD